MPLITKLIALASLCSLVLAHPGLVPRATIPSAAKTTSITSATKPTTTSKTTSTSAKKSTSTSIKKTTSTTSASSCQTVTTSTANFDALPTNSAPPPGYGTPGLSWSGGWTVVPASTYGLTASSGSNIVQAPAYGSFLNYGGGVIMQLDSFSFACTANCDVDGGYADLLPMSCGVTIYATAALEGAGIVTLGPYGYTACDVSQGAPCNMTLVELGGLYTVYDFVITSGAATAQFYLDDVVIEAMNDNCPGS